MDLGLAIPYFEPESTVGEHNFNCMPYACMLVCLYACMLVCLYACMLVCLYACMLVCLYACILHPVHILTHTHTHPSFPLCHTSLSLLYAIHLCSGPQWGRVRGGAHRPVVPLLRRRAVERPSVHTPTQRPVQLIQHRYTPIHPYTPYPLNPPSLYYKHL
jgi:hypothetical protein